MLNCFIYIFEQIYRCLHNTQALLSISLHVAPFITRNPRRPKQGKKRASSLHNNGLGQPIKIHGRYTKVVRQNNTQISTNDTSKCKRRCKKSHDRALTTKGAQSRHHHTERKKLEQEKSLLESSKHHSIKPIWNPNLSVETHHKQGIRQHEERDHPL